jgi:hypothetical protein
MAHEHATYSAFFFFSETAIRNRSTRPRLALASFDKFVMLNAVETVSIVEP